MTRLLIVAIVSLLALSAQAEPPAAGEGQAASAPAAEGGQAATEPMDKSVQDAIAVMQTYMTQVSTLGMDGTSVYDISNLPEPKAKIKDALLVLVDVTEDEKTRSDYQTGIMLLAFFQPDVGATPISLEEMGPGDKTWRQVVEKEIQSQ